MIRLLAGDCREVFVPLMGGMRYVADMKSVIRDVATCRACRWAWKPITGLITEPCPRCGKPKSVRLRTDVRDNLAGVKAWRGEKPGNGAPASRGGRRTAAVCGGEGHGGCGRRGWDAEEAIKDKAKQGGGR